MKFVLMRNKSENNVINKNITEIATVNGIIKSDNNNITRPTLIFEADKRLYSNCNYIYIPDFDRYYYRRDPFVLLGQRVSCSCEIDVLESYKSDIFALRVVIDKQRDDGKTDLFIDADYVVENRMINEIYNFSGGFNNGGEFILITVGG